MTETQNAMISIKPEYAQAILEGEKTVELRRRIPTLPIGARLWIYSTLPVGAVVGSAVVGEVACDSPENIWLGYGSQAAISYSDYLDYFYQSEKAYAITLKKVMRRRPTYIPQLRSLRNGFQFPQVLSPLSKNETAKLAQMAVVI